MSTKNKSPGVYVRLDAEDLRRLRRNQHEMQQDSDARITQSDAIRAAVRAGLDALDIPAGRRARRRR